MFKIKNSLSKKSRIRYLNKDCEILHLTKSFSLKYIKKIIKRYKRLEKITVSKTTRKRLGKKTKKYIRDAGIKLKTKTEQGRPIDIKIDKLHKILQMYKDHSYRELEDKINVPKSTIHYIIKYSKRKKLKEGKKIIYLK